MVVSNVIPHNCPSILPEDTMAVSEAISTKWLTQGPLVSKFEDALCRYLANNNRENHLRGAAVSSGSAALFLALKALEIGNGDEVLVPTYACSSLLNAVYLVGATPIILDISDTDFNPTVDMVSKKITDNTRALVLTHTFGVPTDTMAFKELGIRVIEDCAQSIGAKYRGENVGRLGDIATFSFFATKMITTGHGGMVVSDDTTLVERVRDYCNYDGRKEYYPRFNFQMTDFQAALGLSQLDRLSGFIAKRLSCTGRYESALGEKNSFMRQTAVGPGLANGYRFALKLGSNLANAEKLMLDKGITCIRPIIPEELLHRCLDLSPSDFPCAESVAANTLSFPIFPSLSEDQIIRIVDGLTELKDSIDSK